MPHEGTGPSRRKLLRGIGISSAAMLAGCSSGGGGGGGGDQDTTTQQDGGDGGGGGGGDTEPTKIKYVYPGYSTATQKTILPMFHEEYDSVEVVGQKTPASSSSTRKYYVNQFIAQSSSFDVGMMDVIWPAEFVKNGWAAQIEDPNNLTKQMLDTPVDAVTFDGNLYGMPFFTDANALYYRTDLLEKHGYSEPPKTEMELVNMAQDIKQKEDQDLNGYIWQGGSNEGLTIMWLNWLWGREGTVHHDGKLKVNTQKGIDALTHAVKLIHEYGVTPDSIPASSTDQNRKTFQQGNTIFMRNWPYAYSLMNEDGSPVKDKFAVASMPDAEGHVGADNSCLGGWNLFINKFSQNKEAAQKFAQFIGSFEAQKAMALKHSRLPVRKDLYQEKYFEKSQALDIFSEIVEETRARPATPKYSTFSEIVYTECNKALVKSKTPEEALNDAQAQIDERVNNA